MRTNKWLDQHLSRQDGKVFFITGASSGVGLEAAKALCYLGGHVVMAVRNKEKALSAVKKIQEEIPSAQIEIEVYDQGDLESGRDLGKRMEGRHLDAIIFNAGIYRPGKDAVSSDGTPLTFHTNARGLRAVYEGLKGHLEARLVFVTSLYHKGPKKGYKAYIGKRVDGLGREYSVSKEYARDLAYEAMQEGHEVALAHPGVSGTGIFAGLPRLVVRLGQALLPKADISCLGEVVAATDFKAPVALYCPRGIGEIMGYPTKKNPRFKGRDAHLE